MKTLSKRALGLLLSVLMLSTMIAAGCYSVIAATTDEEQAGATSVQGETVYCKNTKGWGDVYCYMWNNSSQTKDVAWPGTKMNNEGNNIWSYNVKSGFDMIIFNNNAGDQTSDLSYAGGAQCFDLGTNSWSGYNPSSTTAPTAGSVNNPTTPPGSFSVYCRAKSWSSVSCYMWNSDKDINASWPGVTMTKVDEGLFEYVAPKQFSKVIFSQGGNSQTSDLDNKGSGYAYNVDTNGWEEYDPNDLQLRDFKGDMDSPQYIGSQITFSVTGKSNSNVIQYQFSVNGSVAQAYSTSSTFAWTADKAGTFKIAVDAKDGDGNTNKKELTYEISDPSQEVSPVFLSSNPGNGRQILLNATTNIKIKAAGGKTGTNLLFYKYVVKNPSGEQMNTAYYTLNDSYSFTPKTAGDYKVEVSVQGSDNQTVTKEITYKAVTKIDESTSQDQPTVTDSTPTVTNPTPTPSQATKTEPSSEVVTPGVLGDANDDGVLNIRDAAAIQHYIGKTWNGKFNAKNADFNKDGTVNIRDAAAIQARIAGLR